MPNGKLDHVCIHEVDLALIAQEQSEMKGDVKQILTLLQGDNGEGLVTRVALVKSSVKKAWWWLGAISFFLLTYGIVKAF